MADIEGEDNVWAAKITGEGYVRYSGSGVVNIKTVLKNGFVDTNNYTGQTIIVGNGEGLTLNLSKTNSFGDTSKVIAENASIVVENASAWGSVNGLQYDGVTTTLAQGIESFTIKNDDEDAVFNGANDIFVNTQAFSYSINDGMVVAENGNTSFENSGGSMRLSVGEGLTVNRGGSLSILGSNAGVNVEKALTISSNGTLKTGNYNSRETLGSIVADVVNLYESSTISTGVLYVGSQLNFFGDDDADGLTYSQDTSATDGVFSVTLSDGANITYGTSVLDGQVSETTIEGGSSLTVTGTSALGRAVNLGGSNEKEANYFTIIKKDSDASGGGSSTWELGEVSFSSKVTSEDAGKSIYNTNSVVVQGTGDPEEVFTI